MGHSPHWLGCLPLIPQKARNEWGTAQLWSGRKGIEGMNRVRGVLMLVASVYAFYKGWRIHTGSTALLGYGLGVMAFGLAIFHLTRAADQRRLPGPQA